VIMVSQAVMDYMNSFTDESLKKQPPELIITCREYLQKIFDRLVVSRRRKQIYKFYSFWRGLILKLITSRSLPLRLTGWEQLKDCIEACKNHRPPPNMFEVSQAGGLQFVNGIFEFAGVMHYSGRVCPVFPERTSHCFVVQCAHSKNGGFYLRQTKSNRERIETLIITSTSRRNMRSCNLPLAWLGNMPKCRH